MILDDVLNAIEGNCNYFMVGSCYCRDLFKGIFLPLDVILDEILSFGLEHV